MSPVPTKYRKVNSVFIQESLHQMQNFATDASHTVCTDSKVAGQAIFLAIVTRSAMPLGTPTFMLSSPEAYIPFIDHNDLTPQLSLPHSLSFTVNSWISCRNCQVNQPPHIANVSPSSMPSVNIPIATKVSPTLVRHVPHLRFEVAFMRSAPPVLCNTVHGGSPGLDLLR
ncbi:hypothetical protein E2C01_018924 [Portunus trituberculatus]|uniref:Uncharacterized protein n=1 Tax=Portunus trituberculatus TaxID=210409 RepID=A0A5B7DVV2_PORTR|nr:hypothetical protein [Portunus trituberculatus]